MDAPYREVAHVESLEAPTRRGTLRLEIAPRHVQLDIKGVLHLVIHEQYLTWIELAGDGGGPTTGHSGRARWWPRRKKPAKRSVRLGAGQLLVARSYQTEELSLWFEEKPGRYRRLVGIEPVVLLDAEALDAWKRLERLARRLRGALAEYAREAVDITEYGRGQHRALVVDYAGHFEVLARPVFRERQRPVFRVHRSGLVEDLKTGESGRCVSRFSVTVGGDRIRFDDTRGERVAELHLPWISPDDRDEIARIFRGRVDGAAIRDRAATEADARDPGHAAGGESAPLVSEA